MVVSPWSSQQLTVQRCTVFPFLVLSSEYSPLINNLTTREREMERGHPCLFRHQREVWQWRGLSSVYRDVSWPRKHQINIQHQQQEQQEQQQQQQKKQQNVIMNLTPTQLISLWLQKKKLCWRKLSFFDPPHTHTHTHTHVIDSCLACWLAEVFDWLVDWLINYLTDSS